MRNACARRELRALRRAGACVRVHREERENELSVLQQYHALCFKGDGEDITNGILVKH